MWSGEVGREVDNNFREFKQQDTKPRVSSDGEKLAGGEGRLERAEMYFSIFIDILELISSSPVSHSSFAKLNIFSGVILELELSVS